MTGPSPPLGPEHWVDHHASEHAHRIRRAWLRDVAALAEVMFETREGAPPAERLRWLAWQLDDFLARVGWRSQLVFRGSLLAVSWGAPLMIFRPLPLRWLSRPRRAQALERFERSPLSVALFAVKALMCIIYYEHPEAARQIGFDGRCLGETPHLVET